MAELTDFKAALAKVDAETTRIGELIKKLVDQLANGGLTAEQEAEALAGLKAAGEKLAGIGADAENPVPDPV